MAKSEFPANRHHWPVVREVMLLGILMDKMISDSELLVVFGEAYMTGTRLHSYLNNLLPIGIIENKLGKSSTRSCKEHNKCVNCNTCKTNSGSLLTPIISQALITQRKRA